MAQRTRIFGDIDYDRDGKQVGWLYLPYSVTRSAYGNIAFPIAVIKNGKGPTVLFTAGTHGDEYEGQIALTKLIRALEPGSVAGRVIIMPAANLPAALAASRVSPLDGGNLNRVYPGDADGTPTWAIAHYIETVLFPLADFYHDLHAGGSSLQYQPFVSMRQSDNPELDRRAMAALRAFGAPLGLVWAHAHGSGLAISSAIARGIVALGGEFGGSGAVSRSGVALVERGILLRPRAGGRALRAGGRVGPGGRDRPALRRGPFRRRPGAGAGAGPFPHLRHRHLHASLRPHRTRRLCRPSRNAVGS